MDNYFENVPLYGDFFLEHIFYEYEEPILFTCLDQKKERFLCSCSRIGEQWLIGKISNQLLLSVLDQKVTLECAFHRCDPLFCLSWNGVSLSVLPEVPENSFPRRGAYLRLTEHVLEEKELLLKKMKKLEERIVFSQHIDSSYDEEKPFNVFEVFPMAHNSLNLSNANH